MNELAVLAKYWEPGKVKTRLAADIGPVSASRIYREIVVTLLSRLANIGGRRWLIYSPPARKSEFGCLVRDLPWDLGVQSDGDLGRRLTHIFQQRFDAGASSVVVIGSDSPNLPLEYLERAFDGLRRYEVALGPSTDGGYYLVGLRRPHPGLFAGIDWSTSRVWEQTGNRLRELQLDGSVVILPEWYDVDSSSDLRRLLVELIHADEGPYAELIKCCQQEASEGPRCRGELN